MVFLCVTAPNVWNELLIALKYTEKHESLAKFWKHIFEVARKCHCLWQLFVNGNA